MSNGQDDQDDIATSDIKLNLFTAENAADAKVFAQQLLSIEVPLSKDSIEQIAQASIQFPELSSLTGPNGESLLELAVQANHLFAVRQFIENNLEITAEIIRICESNKIKNQQDEAWQKDRDQIYDLISLPLFNKQSRINFKIIKRGKPEKEGIVEMRDFDNLTVLGSGAFGQVYKAEYRGNCKEFKEAFRKPGQESCWVAIKIPKGNFAHEHKVSTGIFRTMTNEIGPNQEVKFNIVLGAELGSSKMQIAISELEYYQLDKNNKPQCANLTGYLEQYLPKNNPSMRIGIMATTLSGQVYESITQFNDMGWVQGDISARNIFIGKPKANHPYVATAKIADVGLAEHSGKNKTVNTSNLLAPIRWSDDQRMMFAKMSALGDLYSYRIVILEKFALLLGKDLYTIQTPPNPYPAANDGIMTYVCKAGIGAALNHFTNNVGALLLSTPIDEESKLFIDCFSAYLKNPPVLTTDDEASIKALREADQLLFYTCYKRFLLKTIVKNLNQITGTDIPARQMALQELNALMSLTELEKYFNNREIFNVLKSLSNPTLIDEPNKTKQLQSINRIFPPAFLSSIYVELAGNQVNELLKLDQSQIFTAINIQNKTRDLINRINEFQDKITKFFAENLSDENLSTNELGSLLQSANFLKNEITTNLLEIQNQDEAIQSFLKESTKNLEKHQNLDYTSLTALYKSHVVNEQNALSKKLNDQLKILNEHQFRLQQPRGKNFTRVEFAEMLRVLVSLRSLSLQLMAINYNPEKLKKLAVDLEQHQNALGKFKNRTREYKKIWNYYLENFIGSAKNHQPVRLLNPVPKNTPEVRLAEQLKEFLQKWEGSQSNEILDGIFGLDYSQSKLKDVKEKTPELYADLENLKKLYDDCNSNPKTILSLAQLEGVELSKYPSASFLMKIESLKKLSVDSKLPNFISVAVKKVSAIKKVLSPSGKSKRMPQPIPESTETIPPEDFVQTKEQEVQLPLDTKVTPTPTSPVQPTFADLAEPSEPFANMTKIEILDNLIGRLDTIIGLLEEINQGLSNQLNQSILETKELHAHKLPEQKHSERFFKEAEHAGQNHADSALPQPKQKTNLPQEKPGDGTKKPR